MVGSDEMTPQGARIGLGGCRDDGGRLTFLRLALEVRF
jgi:hypothetical protein